MGIRGEFVPEVAEGVLDLAEGLVVGQLGERVGHAFEGGVATEEFEDTLATGKAIFGDRGSSKRGVAQHEDHPGVGLEST